MQDVERLLDDDGRASMRPPRNAGEMVQQKGDFDLIILASMRPPRNAGEMGDGLYVTAFRTGRLQ